MNFDDFFFVFYEIVIFSFVCNSFCLKLGIFAGSELFMLFFIVLLTGHNLIEQNALIERLHKPLETITRRDR